MEGVVRSLVYSGIRTMSGARRIQVLQQQLQRHGGGGGLTVHRTAGLATDATSAAAAAAVLATRRSVDVLDSHMSVLDTGHVGVGDNTVVFLHGNPTQAFLWRHVIPHVQSHARCIAPDLIGCGYSGKLTNHDYRIAVHYEYLSELLTKLDLPQKLTFVIHDWGSALGFHWCNMHRDRVKGIIFMEAIVDVVHTWSQFPEVPRKAFQRLRTPAGDDMVLKQNFFVERLLPGAILRDLTEEEMEEYRRPFRREGEDRRPTLTFPREIPIEGEPKDVHDMVVAYNAWLRSDASVRKLYIDADPGTFAPGIRRVVAGWPNLRTVRAAGSHFLQEDSPDVIGRAVAEFVQSA